MIELNASRSSSSDVGVILCNMKQRMRGRRTLLTLGECVFGESMVLSS